MIEEDRRLRAACTRTLSGHVTICPSEMMRRLAHQAESLDASDIYGEGGAVQALEGRVREVLGKPSALFFAKGMVAQMSVLKVHSERSSSQAVALHPQSHLDVDEFDALNRVIGLRPVRLGRHMPFAASSVTSITEPIAAITIELPLRRAGYMLPSWHELVGIGELCRERKIAFHIDGARLWEAAAAYGVPPAAIAALADTVYVSFYKGLGGLGGAVLVGDPEIIRACKTWRTRLGGNLYTSYPLALSSLDGLNSHLPRMPTYVKRARDVAAKLNDRAPQIINCPAVMANAFHLLLVGTPDELAVRNRAFAERERVWLFSSFTEAPVSGRSIGEVVIGDASDAWSPSEAAEWVYYFASADGAVC